MPVTPVRINPPMPFMHESARNRPRPGIEVLVVTPHGKVHVPVVQGERDIPRGVGEVPPHDDAAGAGVGGDERDVEELAGVVLDSGEEEEGGGGGVGVDGGEDGGGGEVEVWGGGLDFDEGGGGGEAVPLDLGLDGVLWTEVSLGRGL